MPDSPAARLVDATDDERADMARMLLDHPLLQATLDDLVADAIATWRAASSAQQREDMWHRQRSVQDLRDGLQKRLNAVVVKSASRKTR